MTVGYIMKGPYFIFKVKGSLLAMFAYERCENLWDCGLLSLPQP